MSTTDPLECYVGLPTNRLSSNHVVEDDPRISKIGGQPIWWDVDAAPKTLDEIRCRNCGSSESVIFVAQMYAPVDYDRSLYLFCCNKRICSITSEGWTVCRNQQSANSSASQKKANSPNITESEPVSKVVSTPSAWGSILEDDDDTNMVMMLAARDAALASKEAKVNKKTEIKSAPRKGKEAVVCQTDEPIRPPLLPPALFCWKVEAVSDPCPFGADVLIHAALQGGDDEEDEVRSALSSVTMQHVQQMLAGYIAAAETENIEGGEDQGRDDPALIDLLKKEVLTSTAAAAKISREDESSRVGGGGVTVATTKMKHTKSRSDGNRDTSKAIVGGSNVDAEKEEDAVPVSSNCLSRVEGAFAAAVSHAPSQVVRFAYGGYPLWCTYPPPSAAAAVPLCRCGAKRMFEMQLMPARMRRTPAIPMFHSSILVTASLSGLLSLHPLFLPVQEKKTGYVKEQETKKWIKGEVEGAGEGKVIIAGEMDSETPPTAAPAVPTVSKGPSSSSGPGPGPLCKSNTQTVLDQLSDSTFDFGVVAVYSCPNSCSSIRNNNDDSISNNEKSDKNTSHNIAENVSTSHNITASAGHVYYEYIVVQPPADF